MFCYNHTVKNLDSIAAKLIMVTQAQGDNVADECTQNTLIALLGEVRSQVIKGVF